jgi:hypothetical protein
MADKIVPADLKTWLIEHQKYHQRLADGEFEDTEGPDRFEEVLTEEHLRPFIESVGPRGVAGFLHLIHEALIVILNDIEMDGDFPKALADIPQEDRELHDLVAFKIGAFMQWATMSLMTGRFEPMTQEPQPPLGERQQW